jgi:hypothetical protein
MPKHPHSRSPTKPTSTSAINIFPHKMDTIKEQPDDATLNNLNKIGFQELSIIPKEDNKHSFLDSF